MNKLCTSSTSSIHSSSKGTSKGEVAENGSTKVESALYGSTKGEAAEGGSGSFSGLVLRPTDYLHHNHKSKKRCLDYQVDLDSILY